MGEVVLSAANLAIADRNAPSFPAVVNHVVYFGDGISTKTALCGFRVTSANNYTTGTGEHSPIESDAIRKTPFFYLDGGGMKLCADACPTIERVEVVGNYTSPCGAGVSVEHLGTPLDAPVFRACIFRDCIFRDNRTLVTGAAFDLLHGSRATLENCLFVRNMANLGVDYVGLLTGGEYHPEHRSGAITVFEGARAEVRRCIFTVNWAGVDDNGTASTYVKSICWDNTLQGRNLNRSALRNRHHQRRWRKGVVQPRRDQRPEGNHRSGNGHRRSDGSPLRRPVRAGSTGAPDCRPPDKHGSAQPPQPKAEYCPRAKSA